MSCSVSSGKSAITSACDMPAASQPSTSATAIRIPRTQGLPPRLPGSIVMIPRTSMSGLYTWASTFRRILGRLDGRMM